MEANPLTWCDWQHLPANCCPFPLAPADRLGFEVGTRLLVPGSQEPSTLLDSNLAPPEGSPLPDLPPWCLRALAWMEQAFRSFPIHWKIPLPQSLRFPRLRVFERPDGRLRLSRLRWALAPRASRACRRQIRLRGRPWPAR